MSSSNLNIEPRYFIIGQININSTTTKFDESKPLKQYLKQYIFIQINGNDRAGSILVYVRKDIWSKLIKTNLPNPEDFFLELNLRKRKWVISYSYNPHNQTVFSHTEIMGKAVVSLSSKFENFLIIGDFTAQTSDTFVKDLYDFYSFKHLIKKTTCYENPINAKCIISCNAVSKTLLLLIQDCWIFIS